MVLAADLSANRVPSIRAIRAALPVGQPRVQRLNGYLATVTETPSETLAAGQPSGALPTTGDSARYCRTLPYQGVDLGVLVALWGI
jgi:hypothetical protein